MRDCTMFHRLSPIRRRTRPAFAGRGISALTAVFAVLLLILADIPTVHAAAGQFDTESLAMIGELSGGPLRVLYVGERSLAMTMSTAIAARMETGYRVFATPGRDRFPGGGIGLGGERFDALMAGEWDVIWLGFDPAALPDAARDALLDAVSAGTGLVYAGEADDMKPYATGGGDDTAFQAAFDGVVKTDMAGSRGSGMMIAVNPVAFGDPVTDEQYLFATMNAMISSARRGSELAVTGIRFAGRPIVQESMVMLNFRIDLLNSGTSRPMDIRQRYVDQYGRVAFEKTERFNVADGRSFMLLEYPLLPAGKYSFAVVFADGDGAAAMGGASFEVTSETWLTNLYPWYAGVPNGGYIPCTVELSTSILADMRFEAELVDMHGRIIDRSIPSAVPGRRSSTFTLHATDVPGRMATIRVYYRRGNLLVDTMEAPIYIQKNYNSRDFSLVFGDSGISPLCRVEGIARLTDAGAGWIVSGITTADTPGSWFRRGAQVLQAGAGIFPSLGGISGVTPEMARAVADTLRHFAPPAYVLSGDTGDFPSAMPGTFEPIQAALVSADSTVRAGMAGLRFESAGDVALVAGISDLVLTDEPIAGDGASMGILASIDSLAWPDAVTGTMVRQWPEMDVPLVRTLPWKNLFAGLNSIWWGAGGDGAFTVLMPDGTLAPAAAALAEAANEIGGGIGRLLLGAEPVPVPEWLTMASGAEMADGLVTRVFRDGGAWYIGMLLSSGSVGNVGTVTCHIDVSALGAAPAVYEVRSGAFLGVTGSIAVDMEAGKPVLLALLPDAVRDVTLTGLPQMVMPGEVVTAAVGIRNRPGSASPGRHVLRVELAGPDGAANPWRTTLVDTGGENAVSFFIASNDPPGQWTVTVTDILSGRRAERGFIVRRPVPAGGM